ncbi:MAG: hypothetical protein RRY40_04135, partial [Oscillospiraceae bacterium]
MKGIVVEIKGSRAAVLTDNGIVELVKNKNYNKGQVIFVKTQSKIAIISASVAAAVIIVAGGSTATYLTPYSVVSMDINPSIELSLNRYDNVLKVVSENEDAQKALANVNLKNLKVDVALKEVTKAVMDNGYIKDGNGGVVISASSKNESKAQKLAENLGKEITAAVNENVTGENKVSVESKAVTEADVLKAHQMGVTAGKMDIIEKVAATSGKEIDKEFVELWKNIPVKDILAAAALAPEDAAKLETAL